MRSRKFALFIFFFFFCAQNLGYPPPLPSAPRLAPIFCGHTRPQKWHFFLCPTRPHPSKPTLAVTVGVGQQRVIEGFGQDTKTTVLLASHIADVFAFAYPRRFRLVRYFFLSASTLISLSEASSLRYGLHFAMAFCASIAASFLFFRDSLRCVSANGLAQMTSIPPVAYYGNAFVKHVNVRWAFNV